jgi:hypothetical protein
MAWPFVSTFDPRAYRALVGMVQKRPNDANTCVYVTQRNAIY